MSDFTPSKPTRVRMNPSRSTCEEIIRRILVTENKENGRNEHFKNATDFMSYFESLYPSGSSLTKQVQRAIKAMDLAKDDRGYFLIDKTKASLAKEKELSEAFSKTGSVINDSVSFETVFLQTESCFRSYLLELLSNDNPLREYYTTTVDTSDGILFLTSDASKLRAELERLI